MLSALAADRARVADFDTQILVLERALSALRVERAIAQSRLDSYKYPVLTLPTEIVAEIFVQFLPVYPLCPPSTGLLSPTLLTQICGRWREIALETPMLWRAISLSLYAILFHRQHPILDFLGRSGCCPLSIQSDNGDLVAPVPEVFAAVVPHRARWEHLHLYLSPQQLRTIDGPMPLLRYLYLSLDDEPDPVGIVAFREMPLLRSVILTAYAPSNIDLPWAQLTSLTLKTVFRSEYVPILQQTSNLIQCELDILFQFDEDADQDEIALPCLESLTLCDSNGDWDGRYPDVFIVPALRSLRVPRSFLGPEPIAALTAFISKSGCKPHEVCITGASLVTSGSFLKAFPSIPKFSFIDPYSDDEEDSEVASDASDSDADSN